MRKYKRVIFAAGNGITRAPMAAEIFKTLTDGEYEVLSRGIIVAFPEPLNQKTEAVMISNGIELTDYASQQITEDDIDEDTVIFTMEEAQRQKILDMLEGATEENTFVVSVFAGEELEVMDPYGGTLQTYGICFESLKATLEKVVARLKSEEDPTWTGGSL